jgi:hypothetical protein
MRRRIAHTAAVATFAALLATTAACGSGDDAKPSAAGTPTNAAPANSAAPSPTAATVEGEQESRERVQNYVDAMKAKSVAKGREQLCEPLRPQFDKAATSRNGDFAKHFTVSEAKLTDVRSAGEDREVGVDLVLAAQGQKVPVSLVFTVKQLGGTWCIANEKIAGNPSASPSAS